MKLPFTRTAPESVAAIDLGSNSFHMIVARLKDGQLIMLDRLREMVRLGAGLDPDSNLRTDAMEHALACLSRFAQRINHMPAGSVRIIGTRTLRVAGNSADFLQRAETVLNHPIEIVSGLEEARLIYMGVAHSLDHDPPRPRLVMDIGGGSTELIIGKAYSPLRLESLGLGCVSLSERFFADGTITRKGFTSAMFAVFQALEPYEHLFSNAHWEEVIGASGTIKSIGRILTAAGWSDGDITREGLDRLVDRVIEVGNVKSLILQGLSEERRMVFAGGLAVLAGLFTALGITRMKVSESALREGVLFDMVGRLRAEDVRGQSIRQLSERFGVDEKHAEQVRETLQTLIAQLIDVWQINEETARHLEWAALLHEIGLSIAHSQYHKHGAYIVENADLLGFSRQEQAQIALFIRTHRNKIPGALLKTLDKPHHKPLKLIVLLRLSILLHRSRGPIHLPSMTLHVDKEQLGIVFPQGWLDSHPLTQTDLETEAYHLSQLGFTLTFQ